MSATSREPSLSAEILAPLDTWALKDNLATLTDLVRGKSSSFATLLLISPEGNPSYRQGDLHFTLRITQSLNGGCDERNSAILDKIYQIARVEVDEAEVDEDDNLESFTRTTRLHSPHGFTISEEYTRSNKWEHFRVIAQLDEEKLPDRDFLFGVDPQ